MTREPYSFGPPREADAPALGALHVRIWRHAYRGIIPYDVLDGLDEQAFVNSWQRLATDPDPRETVLVATHSTGSDDDGLCGFILVLPARDGDQVRPIELGGLNVAPEHHGTGVAQQLVDRALGDRPAYLWVAGGNSRAIAFYRKLGFEFDGATKDDDQLRIRELRMCR